MANCATNTINADNSSLETVNIYSHGIKEAKHTTNNGIVHSYGGQTVDMSGDWNWKDGINCKISKYDDIIKETAKRLNLDWRLCAAMCEIESGFNPNARSRDDKAWGLWQFIFWKDNAPKGYEDKKWAFNPRISTLGYENYMSKKLKLNANATTRNDQIALAIQCYHDGSLGRGYSAHWHDRIRGKYGDSGESYEYVPKIIKLYKEYCSR